MSERATLMRKIQMCDFALVEINEFLNTHPNNQHALASYREHVALSKQLHNEYNRKYGPIVATDFDCDRTWAWIDEPWPWQNCACAEDSAKR